jgi:hypothetical protein
MLTADTARPAIACDEPAPDFSSSFGGRLGIIDTRNTAIIQVFTLMGDAPALAVFALVIQLAGAR